MKVRSKAKRFFAILLSLAMVVSMMPTIAFAAGGSGTPSKIYVLMTEAPKAGDNVIIASGTKALNASAGAATISVSGDKITSVGDAAVWTVSGSGSSMTFYNNSSGKYLRHDVNLVIPELSTSSGTETWTVSVNQMYYKSNLGGTYYLDYSRGFRLRSSSSSTIAFYKEITLVSKPEATDTSFTYNKGDITLVNGGEGYTLSSKSTLENPVEGLNVATITDGNAIGQVAGDYDIIATLKENYKWADESTDPVPIHVTIDKASVDVPTAANRTYSGVEQILVTKGTDYTLSSQTGAGIDGNGNAVGLNAGDYEFTATLKDSANYEWNDSHIENGFDGKVTASIAPQDATIAPKSDEFTKGSFVELTASEKGVCGDDSIGYVILVKDKNGKVINTLDEDGKTYEPVTGDQLNKLVVGEYTLSIQLLEDDASKAVQANYDLTTNGTATLKVTPKSSDVKVWDNNESKFVANADGNGLTITGTNASGTPYTDENASGGRLTVEVLSQRDPITPTSEATLVLADKESVIDKFEVNLYLSGVKMNTGSKLNNKIQVQVPVNAKDGVYKIAHWDGTKYEILSDPGVVSGGILTFATDEFSPFVIIGTTTYVKMIGTPADTEKYTVTFDNSYGTVVVDSDGTALSVKDEDYVFTVTAKPGYQIDSVTANGVMLTGAGGTYTITAASENSTIVVNASPADVTLTIDNNGTIDNTTYADIPYGVSVNLPGEPARTGYTFGGWHSTKENKTYGAGDPFIPTVNDTLTAVWLADIIVSYAGVTGTVPTDTVVHAGDSFILPEAPTHDDQVFTGWKSANTGMIFAAETLYTPAADDTMTAQWTDKYVITVDPADGSGTTTTNKVAPGSNVTVPAAPARTGYIFGGWYSDANAQTYAPGYLYTPAGNDTLTAQWKQLYTVNYDKNGATSGTEPTETAKVEGTVFTVKGSDLTKDDHTFAGWKSEVNGVIYQPGDDYTMTAENTTFTAQWTADPKTYTVTYDRGSEPGTDPVPTETPKVEGATFTIKATDITWAGHTFVGWKSSVDNAIYAPGATYTMTAAATTFTAQWEADPTAYVVKYDADGGSGTVPTETDKVAGTIFAVKATDITKTGYTFVGWKSDADDALYQPGDNYTMTAAATTFTAQWAAVDKYSVTYNVDGTKIVDGTKYEANAEYTVDATAPTKTGYTFVGWKSSYDNAVYNAGDSFNMPSVNVTLTAQWKAQYTVTYNICGKTTQDTTKYDANALYTITHADPTHTTHPSDYIFVGWLNNSDGVIYNKDASFNMPAENVTLIAQWIEKEATFKVTYDLNGGVPDSLCVNIDNVKYNQEVKIKEAYTPTKDGYTFAGWENSYDMTIYQAGDNFNMPPVNVTLTAQWNSIVKYDLEYDGNGNTDGTAPDKQQEVSGTIVNIKDKGTLEKGGYRFVEWNTKPDGSGDTYAPGNKFIFPEENTVLYAQWAKVYTVEFKLNGGEVSNAAIPDQTVIIGDYVASVGKINDYTVNVGGVDKNYYFTGWKNQNGDFWSFEYDTVNEGCFKDGVMTLTAQWDEVKHYNIVFDDNLDYWYDDYVTVNGLRGTSFTVPNVAANSTISYANQPAFERVNYTFQGWHLDKECSGNYKFEPANQIDSNQLSYWVSDDKTVTVYAEWKWEPVKGKTGSIEFNNNTLDEGTYGVFYSDYIEAIYKVSNIEKERIYRNFYKISGNLPEGLALNQRTGEIYGVPTKAGTYTFEVEMYDDEKFVISDVKEYTITIKPIDLSVDRAAGDKISKVYGQEDTAFKLKADLSEIPYSSHRLDYTLYGKPLNAAAPTEIATFTDVTLNRHYDQNYSYLTYKYDDAETSYNINAESFATAGTKSGLEAKLMYAKDLKIGAADYVFADINDQATAEYGRNTKYEDVGTYKIYLDADKFTVNKPAEYALSVAPAFSDKNVKHGEPAVDYALQYLFGITEKDVNYSVSKVYGEVKNGTDLTGAGSWTGLVDIDGLYIKDEKEFVKVVINNVEDTNLSSSKHLRASATAYTGYLDCGIINKHDPINNIIDPVSWGTIDADTTANYNITTALTITQKGLTVSHQTVNVTKGTVPTVANIEALAKLNGVIGNDNVTLTVTKYTADVNGDSMTEDYATAADLVAAFTGDIKLNDDMPVTVTYSGIDGTDAGNYSISGGTVDATLKAYTAPSGGGGGGGGGGAIIVPPTPATSGHAAYMQGDDLGYFRPDANMTRAEAATVFYNILTDKSMGEESAVFTDVNSGDWYAKAVTVLASKGILGGYEDGSFQPSKSITRAEFVTIASRLKGLSEGTASFTDVSSDHWAYDYITSAASKGWITGYPDGTFKPEANITRAEVATIVNRMYGRIPDEDYIDANIDDISIMRDVKKSHWAFYQIIEATNGHDAYKDSEGNEVWTEIL